MGLPLGTIILNIGYITAIFQLTICPKPGEQKTIKVASYNVNNFYTDKVQTLSSIATFMKDEEVDLICLQEVANIDKWLRLHLPRTLETVPDRLHIPFR